MHKLVAPILVFCVVILDWSKSSKKIDLKNVDIEKERELRQKFENEEFEVKISREYRRGPHLIYDCEDKHFACVSPASRERCLEKRQDDLEKKEVRLSCAPLKEFDSKADCERTQQNVMHRLIKKEFCWNLGRRSLYEY